MSPSKRIDPAPDSPLKGKPKDNIHFRRVNHNSTSQKRGSYFGVDYLNTFLGKGN